MSGLDGVNVATWVVVLYVTIPGTAVPELVTRIVMFVALIVAASIASLNVMLMAAVVDTPVAPFAGEVAMTDGAISSRVVNVEVNGTAAFPDRSLRPAVTVTVMLLAFGSALVGLNSAVRAVAL